MFVKWMVGQIFICSLLGERGDMNVKIPLMTKNCVVVVVRRRRRGPPFSVLRSPPRQSPLLRSKQQASLRLAHVRIAHRAQRAQPMTDDCDDRQQFFSILR